MLVHAVCIWVTVNLLQWRHRLIFREAQFFHFRDLEGWKLHFYFAVLLGNLCVLCYKSGILVYQIVQIFYFREKKFLCQDHFKVQCLTRYMTSDDICSGSQEQSLGRIPGRGVARWFWLGVWALNLPTKNYWRVSAQSDRETRVLRRGVQGPL